LILRKPLPRQIMKLVLQARNEGLGSMLENTNHSTLLTT